MTDYIAISELNDFIFCPYSIYLHGVYMGTDEDIYKATPQTRGSIAHQGVDRKMSSHRSDYIMALPVISEKLGLYGKIDVYRKDRELLVERKYQLRQIFRGQIYQLWAQFFCLTEMGYSVRQLAFYEISTNKLIPVAVPQKEDEEEFATFLQKFRSFDPTSTPFRINPNKCAHCIYCNLCDKTDSANVYT